MESRVHFQRRSRSGSAAKRSASWAGYRAYGLQIRSELQLPELSTSSFAAADVDIQLSRVIWPSPQQADTILDLSADTQYLSWPNVARFTIRDAREISVEPAPAAGESLVRLPLLGPVTALLLYLRGHLVFHASAVAIGGKGAIFVGDKMAGKSTTAAALVAAGHQLLADDIVAVDISGDREQNIIPGFPQLKLDNGILTPEFGQLARALPRAHPSFAKRQYRLLGGFPDSPVPPERVYVLERGESAGLTPLEIPQALAALMRFSYVTRFGANILSGPHAASHLKRCVAVAAKTPVIRLTVPGQIDRLGEMVRLVEGDFA